MRKNLTALFLIFLASAASAQTTVREYGDRVVVEATGVLRTPEEKAQRELQERINALEYERRQLADEVDELNRKEGAAKTMDFRQIRDAMSEKRSRMRQVDEQLRDLGYSQPQATPDDGGPASNLP